MDQEEKPIQRINILETTQSVEFGINGWDYAPVITLLLMFEQWCLEGIINQISFD